MANLTGGYNLSANPAKPKSPLLGSPVTTQPVSPPPIARETPGMMGGIPKPTVPGSTGTRQDGWKPGGQVAPYTGPVTTTYGAPAVTPYTGAGTTLTAANVPGYQPQATAGQGITPYGGAPLTETAANMGAPAAPGTFSADHNLIASQVTPSVDPRLAGTQGMVNTAAQTLTGGPDRTALAQQAFADFMAQQDATFGKQQRSITQAAGATGRLGSGMYGSDLTDLASAANRDRLTEEHSLSADLANNTKSDQFNTLGALSGLEGQQYGQGVQDRTEMRGERGYQYGLSQDAVQNQLAQAGLDNQQIAQLMQLGFMNNPAALTLNASGDVQQGANSAGQSVNDLLYQFLLNRSGGKAGG